MLGILRKDLYDTFLIPKNILSNGFGYLFMFLFAYLLGPNYYMMMVFIMLAIPATSVMVLQAAIEQDESVRFDDVLLTYPISKKQIILTRFCGNLIGILLNMALSFLLMLGYVYGGKTTDIQDGIFIWLAGCVISLYAVAVFSVGFYLLGNKKGTIVYVVSILIWAFLYVILRFVAPWEKILEFGRWNLLGIAFAVAIPLLVLSYWGCLKIYEKKHS